MRFAGVISAIVLCPATVGSAAAQDISCEQRFAPLDRAHTAVMLEHDKGTDPYFEALYGVQDRLFQAIERCPGEAALFSLMTEVQLSLGRPGLAAAYGHKAHAMDPDHWRTNHARGSALAAQGRYTAGLPYLERAHTLAPDNTALSFNLCSVYEAAGRYQSAVAQCSDTLTGSARAIQGPAHYVRGRAYSHLGRREQAQADFRQARRLGFHVPPPEGQVAH